MGAASIYATVSQTFFDHVPLIISKDEHVPLKFLITKMLSKITKIP